METDKALIYTTETVGWVVILGWIVVYTLTQGHVDMTIAAIGLLCVVYSQVLDIKKKLTKG